jgi:hypothetical protein
MADIDDDIREKHDLRTALGKKAAEAEQVERLQKAESTRRMKKILSMFFFIFLSMFFIARSIEHTFKLNIIIPQDDYEKYLLITLGVVMALSIWLSIRFYQSTIILVGFVLLWLGMCSYNLATIDESNTEKRNMKEDTQTSSDPSEAVTETEPQ